MPYAVAHMLTPIIILELIKHNILKTKEKLPNKYILIAGLAGLLPDIDILLSSLFPVIVHRGITHTIWIPLAFLLLFSILHYLKKCDFAKVFLMLSVGTTLHIILDFVTAGSLGLFYPLSEASFSVNLIQTILPKTDVAFVYAAFDAVLLFIWFLRLLFRRRVQDIV